MLNQMLEEYLKGDGRFYRLLTGPLNLAVSIGMELPSSFFSGG